MADRPKLTDADYRFYLTARIFDAVHRYAGVIVYLGIARYIYLSVKELAGKTTVADFLLAYITSNTESHGWLWVVGKILPWLLTMLSASLAWLANYLRRRSINSMGTRIKELELRLDPQRSTSTLTSHGETNPRDVI